MRLVDLAATIVAEVLGAIVGVVIANLMFSLPAIGMSTHVRSGPNLWLGEVVATFGLLLVVLGVTRGGRSAAAPFAVGAFITGAYFFTSSTSFADPADKLAQDTLGYVCRYRTIVGGAIHLRPASWSRPRVRDCARPVAAWR